MIKKFKDFKLVTKINLVVVATAMLFLLFIFSIVVPNVRANLVEEKQSQLKNQVDIALSIMNEYNELAKSGKLPIDSAKKTAAAVIATIKYDNDNYLWVQSAEAVVVHPKKELIGENLTAVKDVTGFPIMAELGKMVKSQNEAFIDYTWNKPHDLNSHFPKKSFGKAFAPWGWIPATGVYIDDIDAKVSEFSLLVSLYSIIITLAVVIIGFSVATIINKPVLLTVEILKLVAMGKLDVASYYIQQYMVKYYRKK